MQVASIPSASRCGRLLVEAASKGSSGSSSGSGGKRRRNGRARLPWQYEVKVRDALSDALSSLFSTFLVMLQTKSIRPLLHPPPLELSRLHPHRV